MTSIKVLMLGILVLLPSIIFAKPALDSLVLQRVFSFRRNFAHNIGEIDKNIYLRYSFRILKRNPTLYMVPTMYTIAKGERSYIGETYGRISYRDGHGHDIRRQLVVGTIPRHRRTMSTVIQYITPDIYSAFIFKNHLLSPFNANNHKYYKYHINRINNGLVIFSFRPRLNNTQLLRGYSVVDYYTGRVIKVKFEGEYDMITFKIFVNMGNTVEDNPLLPIECSTEATFKFTGNRIKANCMARYDCPITLPDSLRDVDDIRLMSQIRPDSLAEFEKGIYEDYQARTGIQAVDSVDTVQNMHRKRFKEAVWNIVDDYLWSSIGTETSNASVRVSPLLNPLYFSYSHNRGFAYRLRLGAKYNITEKSGFSFTPNMGYNFKIKQFFFTAPIRYTYDSYRNGWLELVWANGNRITNSSILDAIKNERKDTIDFNALNLDYFNDKMLMLQHNIELNKYVDIKIGATYHKRIAVERHNMEVLGKKSVYYSFAPLITLRLHPYIGGPIFTANYERGLKNIVKSNIEYERWEFDFTYAKWFKNMNHFNIRFGGGFYTNKSTDYFVDYSNFRVNNLPEGIRNEWAADFQLLPDQWYNSSKYYIRSNCCYESPLLLLSWAPFVGRYIETERLYLSALLIEHSRPYIELGYGFTCRYASIGAFGSFLNGSLDQLGFKFSFDLFRKW